jgi:arabinan endo-1,5-alpha-L-arabinosidase
MFSRWPKKKIGLGLIVLLFLGVTYASLAQALVTAPDPTAIEAPIDDGGGYYAVATGAGIPIWYSSDLHEWKAVGTVFGTAVPTWATRAIQKETQMTWGPDISYHGGTYYLYYSASTPRSPRSVIGLAVNKSLRPGNPQNRWEDRGLVLESVAGGKTGNAIAPALFVDDSGEWYLLWGSGQRLGIRIMRINPATGKPFSNDNSMITIAMRPREAGNAEGPFLVRRGVYYYLFVSWDKCCDGINSDYKIMVGRSANVRGPYIDSKGRKMLDGGGTLVLGSDSRWKGPGSNGILTTRQGNQYIVAHTWDAQHPGAGRILQLRPLDWTKDGWPEAGAPITAEER